METEPKTAETAKAGEDAPPPAIEAGWYPDPDQPQTVRYWDGDAWTDQRAPKSEPAPRSMSGASLASPLLILTLIAGFGVIAVAVGMFLPAADGPMGIPIQNNSMAQSGSWAVFVPLIFAVICTADVVITRRPSTARLVWLLLAGLWIVGMAIRFGSNLPFEPSNRFSAQLIEQNPVTAGAGVYVVAIGGASIALASILTFFNRDEYLIEEAKERASNPAD